jgi:HlyD family secretion protein
MKRLILFAMLLLLWNGPIYAEDAAKNTAPVITGPFKVNVTLDGVFESRSMSEIILRPEEWNELTVKEVLPHGATVRQGDVILQLDPRKITDAIRDLESGMNLAELSIRQNEAEIATLETLLPIDLETANRAKRTAAEDLDRFSKLERDLTIRKEKESLKRSRQTLEMEEAELRELEKMYKADDLTEETEEIILKRQRDEVESAKFRVEVAEIENEKANRIEVPRREESLKEAATRQAAVFEKTRNVLPMTISKLKFEVQKLSLDRTKSIDKLDRLKRDLASMTVKAPRDGILYYGACVLGNWPSSTDMAAKLRRGGNLQANDVVLTIVDTSTLMIRTSVPEKQLANVRRGGTGHAVWADSEECRCDVRVESISAVPIASGKFTAMLDVVHLNGAKRSVQPLPGMTCTVTLNAYAKLDALTVPPAAIHTDEWDEQKRYVYVVNDSGKSEKRSIAVGRRTDKKVEVLSGLRAGENVLTIAPEE